MGNKNILVQAKVLFFLILVNFIAQIPYFFHLYYQTQSIFISMRSFLIMGSVFTFFLVASFLLFKGQRWGFPLMFIFLSIEFLFYFWNVIGSMIHGDGIFFQVHNPDLILRIVYSIGYMNLFASGYFLILLLRHKGFNQGESR